MLREMRFFVIFLGGVVCGGLAHAGAELSFETTEYVDARDRDLLEQALQLAVRQVRELAPRRGNPFRSRVHRPVHLVWSTVEDPVVRKVLVASRAIAPVDESDAFTLTTEVGGELVTYVFLLADRLVWDPETGQQRPDAFIRLVAALGHEIYGNVAIQLKLEFGKPPVPSAHESYADEIFSFRSGASFLRRYRKSKYSDSETADQIQSALARETANLKEWIAGDCARVLIVRGRGRSGGRAPRS